MSSASEEKPSTSQDFWVYYNHTDESKWTFDAQGRLDREGKWMLFYPKEELDSRWEEACNHFAADRFGEVADMKVSTFRPNPRASDPNWGVIVLYTPHLTEQKQKATGYAIMNAMGYQEKMYYKTDDQTSAGTSATGQIRNHTYCIAPRFTVPDVFANVSWDEFDE